MASQNPGKTVNNFCIVGRFFLKLRLKCTPSAGGKIENVKTGGAKILEGIAQKYLSDRKNKGGNQKMPEKLSLFRNDLTCPDLNKTNDDR